MVALESQTYPSTWPLIGVLLISVRNPLFEHSYVIYMEGKATWTPQQRSNDVLGVLVKSFVKRFLKHNFHDLNGYFMRHWFQCVFFFLRRYGPFCSVFLPQFLGPVLCYVFFVLFGYFFMLVLYSYLNNLVNYAPQNYVYAIYFSKYMLNAML